jgi:hypothetical protein
VRDYILRRAKHEFRIQRGQSAEQQIAAALAFGSEQLALIRRQSAIVGFYKEEPSVMEVVGKKKRGNTASTGGL